ncbi:MAG: AMP-binding protein [Burkholderiales bacterium]|nr:AMP-binding protein [Burkholderiales bacterium]
MAQPLRKPNAPQSPAADDAGRLLDLLRALVAETQHGAPPPVSLDSRLVEDLGIDSLARVELNLRCERAFGRRLDDQRLAAVATPREILEALQISPAPAATPRVAATAEVTTLFAGSPDAAATLAEVIGWHVERHPQRRHVTLVDDQHGETLAYGELHRRALVAAAALRAHGLAPGATCALMLPTSLEFFVVFCGVLYAGGVPVPLYPPARPSALEDHLKRQAGILANCEAPLLVTVAQAKPLGHLLRPLAPTLRHVLTPEDLDAAPLAAPLPRGAGDLALLQYTSGSTGSPKGVMLTHGQLLANLRAMGRAVGAGPHDVFVSWLPLYHDMGLIGAWMGSLYFGMHLVLMSPLAFLARPSRWLQAISQHRGTISAAPNFAYEICASRIDVRELAGLDLSSWRWAFNGAEAVSADTLDRFARRLAPFGFDARAVAPVYGLAECGLDLAFPPPRRGTRVDHVDREALMFTGEAVPVAAGDRRAAGIVACGAALPGYAIRIVDGSSHVLPERQQGRVQFRGPSATAGYYRNPQATAELLDGEWRNTGDLGYLAGGELFVTGRDKDLIIRAGHNLHPLELEAAVGELPGIRKGCVVVFGVADPRGATERVVVVAETRETEPQRQQQLRGRIQALAAELIDGPADEVLLVPPGSVLKTSSGKLRRAGTRDAYLGGRLGAGTRAVWLQLARLGLRGAAARLRQAGTRAARAGVGAWAWAVGAVVAALGWLGVLLVPGVARRRRLARRLAGAGLRTAGVRLRLEGEAYLPAGAHVLVSNHASYLDAIVLTALLPPRYAFVAKRELSEHWLTEKPLRGLDTRFVERVDTARSIDDTRALSACLAAGESLVFFPEGTFGPGQALLPLRMGAFVLAAQADVPLVPAVLEGTRALLPAGAVLPRPGQATLRIGKPLRAGGFGWNDAVALREEARKALESGAREVSKSG